jgi:hypothetical protein
VTLIHNTTPRNLIDMHTSNNHYDLQLLIAGQPVRDFTYAGTRCLVVALGQTFTLRVTNRSYSRVEALIAVDGLSVMDGKLAGDSQAGGYIVPAGQSIDVPGYRLSDAMVASFVVTDTAGSYAAQIGAATDVGIIGVRVYAETPSFHDVARGYENLYEGLRGGGPMLGGTMRSAAGTGFGASVDHSVREVSFKRGALLAELLAEYNTVEGFAAEGVVVPPVRRPKVAFPKSGGCAPPVGWTG